MTYSQYEEKVKSLLTEKRFYHSQCVAREAVKLAERYGADREKALVAGILHDIMKDTPKDEQLKIIENSDILLSDAQRQNPKLWHSIAGSIYIKGLGVDDEEIITAVRYHTSGRKGMSLLEKVIFIADFISEDRDYPGIEEMRETSYESLEKAMLIGIEFTVGELMEQRLPVAVESIEAYNDALCIWQGETIANPC